MTNETPIENPLLQPWTGEYGLPPFARVRAEHFDPAFEVAMREHRAEIDAIGDRPEPPELREHRRPRSTAPAADSTGSPACSTT